MIHLIPADKREIGIKNSKAKNQIRVLLLGEKREPIKNKLAMPRRPTLTKVMNHES
jgi:hypothetical protein